MTVIINEYKYVLVPFLTWLGIQIFKVLWDFHENKKLNIKRLFGAGGMPSSHSAVVMALATMMGKYEGLASPQFAISAILALIVMHDAAGVRRAVGKQAKVLNDIITNQHLTSAEKLQEMTGHTPFQVFIGAIIGFTVGILF